MPDKRKRLHNTRVTKIYTATKALPYTQLKDIYQDVVAKAPVLARHRQAKGDLPMARSLLPEPVQGWLQRGVKMVILANGDLPDPR